MDVFRGAGDLAFEIHAWAASNASWDGGNVTVSQETYATVGGSVTYEYEYSSVPEATTLLLGLAAGGPLLMHRGRRRVVA